MGNQTSRVQAVCSPESLGNTSGNNELISDKSRLLASGRSGPEKKWPMITLGVVFLETCGHDQKCVDFLVSPVRQISSVLGSSGLHSSIKNKDCMREEEGGEHTYSETWLK